MLPPGVGRPGNVTVAFGALSYAGGLTLTVIVDPDRVPNHSVLTKALEAEPDSLGVTEPAGAQPAANVTDRLTD